MARKIEQPTFELIESDIETVATPIQIDGVQVNQPHCFVGVQFFSDAAGTPEDASAGTVTVTVATINTEPKFEDVPSNVIDATAPTTVSWAANTSSVLLTPDSLATATHWRAILTTNLT